MSRTLPVLAAKLCFAHGGWIVGGACVSDTPRDFDIVIPISNWTDAAMLVPLHRLLRWGR